MNIRNRTMGREGDAYQVILSNQRDIEELRGTNKILSTRLENAECEVRKLKEKEAEKRGRDHVIGAIALVIIAFMQGFILLKLQNNRPSTAELELKEPFAIALNNYNEG